MNIERCFVKSDLVKQELLKRLYNCNLKYK